MPELNELADIDIVSLDNISSTQINSEHWIRLKQLIEKYLNKEDYDGVVISHGTNTVEETAYFLHLTVNSAKPIVLVGAQRPYTAISSDAQLNLINAVRVAAHAESVNKGVVLVFNNKIHSAREATKTDTYNVDGFHSGNIGCLGFIDASHKVVYYRMPIRKHTVNSVFNQLEIDKLPNVEIVYSYAGASGDLINYIIESNKYDGIVIAGTGAGRFSKKEEDALINALHKKLRIARSSRVGGGRVIPIDPFKHMDIIHADNLNPQKARILLALGILYNNETKAIQQIFDEY